MALQNKIFSNTTIPVANPIRDRFNRSYLLDNTTAYNLNAYKNMGIFPTQNDVSAYDDKELKDNNKLVPQKSGTPGVRSLFNPYSAVLTGAGQDVTIPGIADSKEAQMEAWKKLVGGGRISDFRFNNNVPLMDNPAQRIAYREASACSVKDLVQASKNKVFGANVYSYADFMYCTYLGRVPNNYLITLRRFPVPVTDSIMPFGTAAARARNRSKFKDKGPGHPVGTMVTWLGVSGNDMSQILSYTYNMPFEEKQAQWESVEKQGGDTGILNTMEAAVNPAMAKAYKNGEQIPALEGFMRSTFNAGGAPYPAPGHFYDRTKVYGPIDRVKSNYQRSEAGLKFNQTFNLVFEYELRSYNGINPKSAMLDLIANILAVTYTNGGFWAGGYRGGGLGQSSAFRNLNIFKCHGSFTEYMDAFSTDIQNVMKAGAEKMKNFSSPMEAVKELANALGGLLIGGLLNKLGRPARYQANSLLSESPVGLWHITIGNPHAPIMTLGNMILKNTKIEHSGPLGLDDFPSNLKVTCEFDRGKPRDQWGIEQMYMKGNDRIFHSMSGAVLDMYRASTNYKGKEGGGSIIEITPDKDPGEEMNKIVFDKDSSVEGSTIVSKDLSDILKEVFGDPDVTGIIWSSREQAEGAFKKSQSTESESGGGNENKSENNTDGGPVNP